MMKVDLRTCSGSQENNDFKNRNGRSATKSSKITMTKILSHLNNVDINTIKYAKQMYGVNFLGEAAV